MIFAVVITYRAPEKLKTCLASLEGQVGLFNWHIQDNSENNILYTKGINVGIRKALKTRAKHILVICDDVILRPNALREMSNYLATNPEAAIAMPLQVSASGKVECGGCTQAFPYGRHVNEPLGHALYEKPYESFWANGACFLLRAEAVRECGLLDENMRFICSDSDYSFTLRSRGWKIFVVPSAIVQHEPDGALHYKNPLIERTKDEDSLYFIRKWLTADLFRQLAAEGPQLSTDLVQKQISILQSRLARGYEE